MLCQSRGTPEATGGGQAKARAQQPEETTDVVEMGMSDKDIRNLVGDTGREAPSFPQVKQQAAPLLTQTQVQQRIPQHPVHQGAHGRAHLHQGAETAEVARAEIEEALILSSTQIQGLGSAGGEGFDQALEAILNGDVDALSALTELQDQIDAQ